MSFFEKELIYNMQLHRTVSAAVKSLLCGSKPFHYMISLLGVVEVNDHPQTAPSPNKWEGARNLQEKKKITVSTQLSSINKMLPMQH